MPNGSQPLSLFVYSVAKTFYKSFLTWKVEFKVADADFLNMKNIEVASAIRKIFVVFSQTR